MPYNRLLVVALAFCCSTSTIHAQGMPRRLVPDLSALLAQPHKPFRYVVQRYEADLGSLQRTYPLTMSPTRDARLQRFQVAWRSALERLPVEKLGMDERKDLDQLRKRIDGEMRKLDDDAASRRSVAELTPFAPVLIDLEEARRRMEKVDGPEAARRLTAVKKQIDDLHKTLAKANETPWTKKQVQLAADHVNGVRAALKHWHGFYDGYDPLYSWWVGLPYKEVDAALQTYSGLLREKLAAKATESTHAEASGAPLDVRGHALPATSDQPDIAALMADSQSELFAIVNRFQTDRFNMSKFKALGLPIKGQRSPERIAKQKRFDTDWLAALEKLNFDKLSRDAKVDYLLLRNALQRDLRGLDIAIKEKKPDRPKDDSGIVGQPIGRASLLSELAAEMIPYSPEELIAIAHKEFAWCEAEMKKASQAMGFGDDWLKAVEKVKTLHVAPGGQPELIRMLAHEAMDYIDKHGLVTVPPLCKETWRMEMMSPQRQLVSPFFTGGETITVAFPTNTMSHEAKLQSLRGNNVHFSRATVQHELIPGHHLQGFMLARYNTHRRPFGTPFWLEGWALYWELVLYDKGFAQTPEDRVGFMFWRMHRCARIVFSLNYHLGKMTPQECIDYLVTKVGHERDNATAEVRRSFTGNYGPLYQAAYLLGGLQLRAMRQELVDSGKMKERDFHDAILRCGSMPIAMVRANLTGQGLSRDEAAGWRFDDVAIEKR